MGLGIGGAETHIVELAKELRRRGNDVAVASAGGVYVPEIEAAGIRHYCVPMNRRDAGLMARSLLLLDGVIRREKPDVVHAHARIPAFLCGLLKKTRRFPFVTTAHWVFDTGGAPAASRIGATGPSRCRRTSKNTSWRTTGSLRSTFS